MHFPVMPSTNFPLSCRIGNFNFALPYGFCLQLNGYFCVVDKNDFPDWQSITARNAVEKSKPFKQ